MSDKQRNPAQPPADAQTLRKRAQERVRAMDLTSHPARTPEEFQRALHELRVHQIELELQNEELRTTQAEIETGRRSYVDLYDLAPVGYATISEEGLILEANLTAATLLGVDRGALIEQPLTRFILEQDQDIYYLHRKKLFEAGEPQWCELRLVKPDGSAFWAWLDGTFAEGSDGEPECRVVLSDISERKQADEALQARERYLATILHTTIDGFWVVDNQKRITQVNDAYCAMSGYSREELLSMTVNDLDAVEAPADTAARIERIIEIGAELFQTCHQRKDGSVFPLEISVTYLPDDGQLVCFCRDITERKLAEEALRENEERLRVSQEVSPDGFTILRPVRSEEGEIVDFAWVYENQAIARINGTDPRDVVGKRLLEHFPAHRGTSLLKAYIDVANTGESHVFEEVFVGEVVSKPTWLRLVIVPITGGIAVLSQNITERKQVEEQLQQHVEDLRVRNDALTRLNAVTTDREVRMIELKREVNELCLKLGEPPRHKIVAVSQPSAAPPEDRK